MDIWRILDILPTRDKAVIKAAYRERLTQVHPEEKPEEFKDLRAAYEQALKEAEKAQKQPERDESPLGLWTERVVAVYNDFTRRIDPDEWRRLCEDEVCFSITGRTEARDKLLHFLMDEYYLPHTAWLVLDEAFGLTAEMEQLKEIYPPAFLERVVQAGIEYDDYVRYEWFSECHDKTPDDYLHRYFKVEDLIRNGDEAEAESALAALAAMSVTHPFTDLLKTRLLIRQDRDAEAHELAEANLALHPDNTYLLVAAADSARFSGAVERSLELYDRLLAIAPEHNSGIYGRAQALAILGRWKASADEYDRLLAQFPSDRNLRQRQRQVYADWAAELEKTHAADPENRRAWLDLAWCWLELDEYQKGLEVMAAFAPRDVAERYEYESTCGNLCLALDKNEEALEHAKGWEQAMRDIPEDTEDEELKKKKGRISRSFEMQAAALAALDRLDEALARLEDAKALDPGQSRIWRSQCQWLLNAKRFEEVFAPAQKLAELLPGDAIGYYYLGVAQFENMDYREAFGSFQEALERDGSTLDFYLYKARILMIYKKWDDARELLQYLADNKVDCDATTFLRARLDQLSGDEETEKAAYGVFRQLLQKPDLELYFKEQLYFAASFDDTLDRKQQLELAEKGLEWRPYDFDLQGRAVWLYNEVEQFEKAIELGERSLKMYPGVVNQIYRLAYAYTKTRQYAKAAALYEQNAKTEEDQEDWYLAGRNYYYAFQIEPARACLEKAVEMDGNDAYALRLLSLLARDRGDKETAIALARRAVTAEQKQERVVWHWQHLGRILEHFNEPEEAAKAWLEYARLDGDMDAYCDVDSVWEKHQQWDRAFEAREEYFRTHTSNKDYDTRQVELGWTYLRMGEIEKLGQVLHKLSKNTEAEEYINLMAHYFLALGQEKKAYKWWRKISEKQASTRQQPVYMMMLHDLGKADEMLMLAASYKKRVENRGEGDEMLLALSSKANPLIFMGRGDEARQLLDQLPNYPLCHHCSYTHCKDGVMARAYLAELVGDYATALRLMQEEYRLNADDTDLVLGILRLKRKMK